MSRMKYFCEWLVSILIVMSVASHTAFASPESEEHNKKGDEYYDAKNYSDAFNEYKAALKLENTALYNTNVGWALYHLEQYDEAEKYFNQSLKLDGNFANAYRGRAWIYRKQGKTEQAKADFNTAGLMYYRLKLYDQARVDFNYVIELDKNNPEYYVNRAWNYYQLEEYDDAKKDFDSAIRINDKYSPAYAGRANLYKTQGQTADAVKDFVSAGKFYNVQAVNTDDIKKKDDLFESARNMFNAAIKSDPNCAEAYYRLGLLEYNVSNYHESITDYDKAVDLKISNKLLDDTYARRGWSNYKLTNYEDAIKDFDKAIDIDPANAYAYEGRAKTYYDSTDYKNALADFNMLVKLDETKANQYKNEIKKCTAVVESTDDASTNTSTQSLQPKPYLNMVEKIFGEMDLLITVLFVIMFLAYVLELWHKKNDGVLTPKVALQEFILKIIFLLFIIIAHAVDEKKLIGFNHLRNIAVILVLLSEFGVILERLKEDVGVPVPDWLINANNAIRTKIKSILGIA